MTVYRSELLIANQTAQLAVQLATNQEVPPEKRTNNGRMDVPSLVIDPIPVTRANLEETLIADGFLKMDELVNYLKEEK